MTRWETTKVLKDGTEIREPMSGVKPGQTEAQWWLEAFTRAANRRIGEQKALARRRRAS